MRSTCIFKISASLLKPARESLLDYCSYCLIVIALIGLARVWIGGESLREGCLLLDLTSIVTATKPFGESSGEESLSIPEHQRVSKHRTSVNRVTINVTKSEFFNKLVNEIPRNSSSAYENSSTEMSLTSQNTTSSPHESEICAKYYQAVFAYILLIESALLLFSGLIWSQIPKIASTLKKFTKLVHKCEESDWARRALSLITNRRQAYDISQSLYSVISSDCTAYDIKSLLDTLFHPDGEYKAKAQARHLYEKVQTFCDSQSDETNVWRTYLLKSIVQFGIWFITFNINLVLFVVFEFYVICPEDPTIPCEHDTFLRIVWFMGQTILLVYAVFNCKTLRWINEKSIVRRRPCCNSFNCLRSSRTFYTSDDAPMLTCKPFRFADNAPVFNDVALLLYLLEEAHPKVLPYFVVFMFPEWKEKLTSFANPVHLSERPIGAAMQMLSGRPPPIIEIIDIPNKQEIQETPKVTKNKDRNAVKFFIGSESKNSHESISKSTTATRSEATNNKSVLLPMPKSSPRKKNKNTSNQKDSDVDLIKLSSNAPKSVSYNKPRSNLGLKIVDSVPYEEADMDEATALVHRTSSSEGIKSSASNEDSVSDLDQISDGSESNLLLK